MGVSSPSWRTALLFLPAPDPSPMAARPASAIEIKHPVPNRVGKNSHLLSFFHNPDVKAQSGGGKRMVALLVALSLKLISALPQGSAGCILLFGQSVSPHTMNLIMTPSLFCDFAFSHSWPFGSNIPQTHSPRRSTPCLSIRRPPHHGTG